MSIPMLERLLAIKVLHIDTNLINARQKLDEVNQLEQWHDDGVILINISSVAFNEATADGNALRIFKANQQLYTATIPAEESDQDYQFIKSVLFQNSIPDENKKNDIRIVCEAMRYNAILVTNDGASKSQPGGILGNRDRLRQYVAIKSPQEAVSFIREKIQERDDFNLRVAQVEGGVLPLWTGKD